MPNNRRRKERKQEIVALRAEGVDAFGAGKSGVPPQKYNGTTNANWLDGYADAQRAAQQAEKLSAQRLREHDVAVFMDTLRRAARDDHAEDWAQAEQELLYLLEEKNP